MNDLPNKDGISSAPVGQLLKPNTTYITSVARELKGDSSFAEDKEDNSLRP